MALRLMISISLNFIWGSMNDMSFLTLLSLISIPVPGIAQIFMKVILKFLYLDVLMTEDWLLPWLVSENKNYYNIDEDEEKDMKRRVLEGDDYDIDDDVFGNMTEKDQGLNEYFEESDIGSMQMLVNIGSTLIYLGVITLSFSIYIITWIFSYFLPR